MTKYRVGRVSRETQEMDERIRAVVERNGGPGPVTIRYVEPRSNGNGQATHDQSSANGDRKHVTKDEVARAIAGLPSDFTCGDVAGAVGLSQSAAKQHVQRLAQDGVVEKTGAVRENGAHVWRLRDRGSKPGANDGAESPTDADSDSAPAAAEDTLGSRQYPWGQDAKRRRIRSRVCLSRTSPQNALFRFPSLSRRLTRSRSPSPSSHDAVRCSRRLSRR